MKALAYTVMLSCYNSLQFNSILYSTCLYVKIGEVTVLFFDGKFVYSINITHDQLVAYIIFYSSAKPDTGFGNPGWQKMISTIMFNDCFCLFKH